MLRDSMQRVAYSQYLLPAAPGRKSPHVSNWKMTSEQAAAIGAIGIVPGTTEMREIPETEEEKRKAAMHYQSAGRESVQPPSSKP